MGARAEKINADRKRREVMRFHGTKAAMLAALFWGFAHPLPLAAGEAMDAASVRAALQAAGPDHPADLAGAKLDRLDLSGANLAGANLRGASLYATKLEGANLTGADLSGANLTLAWVIRANFTKANLSHAVVAAMVVSSGMETNPAEAPIFTGANFSFARVQGHFAGFDFRGANFFHANLAADMRNQSMGLIRADFSGALLDHANFAGADLGRALFRFAKLRGANLRGANLLRADFTGADLTGADFTGADITEADFSQAVLTDTKGLPKTSGKMP
jgi:uncharacterized protein YjbI with pentapeptide repeats